MNERILNLLSLCLQAKEKGHDCFFRYSPHVNGFEVEIYEGSWNKEKQVLAKDDFYGSETIADRNPRIDYLERVLKELIEWQA